MAVTKKDQQDIRVVVEYLLILAGGQWELANSARNTTTNMGVIDIVVVVGIVVMAWDIWRTVFRKKKRAE